MRVFMGPCVVAQEFGDFEVGITFEDLPLKGGKWFIFSRKGVSLHGYDQMKKRDWSVPSSLSDLLFEFNGIRIALLYGKELRMKKLLRKLAELKLDAIVGYLNMEHYNSHLLVANGWGAAQVSGLPTLLVSTLNDGVGYSFFTKAYGLKNGINFLYELYSFVELPCNNGINDKNKSKWNNNGIKGDR